MVGFSFLYSIEQPIGVSSTSIIDEVRSASLIFFHDAVHFLGSSYFKYRLGASSALGGWHMVSRPEEELLSHNLIFLCCFVLEPVHLTKVLSS